jgi:hypothetical protein
MCHESAAGIMMRKKESVLQRCSQAFADDVGVSSQGNKSSAAVAS